MRFEMRTFVRSFGTLAMLLALFVFAGASALAQGRHGWGDRHDNGLHRGWYIGQHRGWYRNRGNVNRRAAFRMRERAERRRFRREERAERRAFRRSYYDRDDRRAFRLRERRERAAFRARERAERIQYRRYRRY
jgi:hypothetical protein